MDEVVVSATKSKTPAKEITRAVTIVDAQGENLSESRPLAVDALRDVPGVYVRRSGQAGRTTSLVLRGASVTQAQIVVDGARLGSPTQGFFDFQFLSPLEVERIEVMRGPASVLYGADAMAGVVSFVTRRGDGPLTGRYTQEVGSRSTFREMASAQAGVGNWHLSGSASRSNTDGVSDNDEFGNTTYSARVGYDFAPDNTLDVTVRHSLTSLGLDDGAFRPDPNHTGRFRQTMGSAVWEDEWAPWWTQSFRFSTQVDNNIDSDPSNGGGIQEANPLSKLSTERYGAEWRNLFTPVEWDKITLGFEFEDREADRRQGGANQNFSKAQQTRAVYVQNQWNPIDALTILTGVRQFRESAFGSDRVMDASASYFFDSLGLKLRGGYGEGFRVPTLNELYFPNFGNENLGPETSETIEFGWDHALTQIWDWAVTFHRTNYQNLIQNTRVGAVTIPLNVGKVRAEGIEVWTELRPTVNWTLRGSYTLTSAHEGAQGREELLRIPNNTFGATLRYATTKWEARLDGLVISKREESTVSPSRQKAEGYPKLDFYAAYQFKEWLKGYLRVDNLTNRNYVEIIGFPTEGITGVLGVTVEMS